MNYKYHIVYQTTNLINNKIYIGFHSTNKLDDNYLGSGKLIKKAISKYGKKSFTKIIIKVCSTRDSARKLERELVNEDFVNRTDTYNLTLGGTGIDTQDGNKNHMYGKLANNRKQVIAKHKDGTVVSAESIDELSGKLNIARGNIRNLLKKGIQGKMGWRIYLTQDIV